MRIVLMVFNIFLNLTTALSLSCLSSPEGCMNGTDPNVFPPPVIEHGPQNQTLLLGDMAMLPCRVIGRITPEIIWLHDSRPIPFSGEGYDERFELLSTGALRINGLTKADNGIYTCRARNNDGEASWSASLAVEDHTNPAAFHRMDDNSKFPSHPSQPIVTNVTTDTVDLEWQPPDKVGSSTIVGYLIQYWSPELGNTWLNVNEVISTTRFKVRHLHPGYTYVFLVRAENKQGIGPPSDTTKPIVMKADYQDEGDSDSDQSWNRASAGSLVKLTSVQALNHSSIELKWELEHFEPLIDGFYIKWRGPPIVGSHKNWINVTSARQTTYIVGDLKPFTYYEFFLVPYHANKPGTLSNSIGATTMEAPPSMPPTNVRVRMTAINTLHVMWKPPPQEAINGVLKGFRVTVSSNIPDHSVRNITTNERATSITLFNLARDATYRIKLAAENNAGVGEYHVSDPIVINNATLQRHLKLTADELERIRNNGSFVERNKIQIIALIIVFLTVVVVTVVFICLLQRCRHRNEKGGTAVSYNQSHQPLSDAYVAYPPQQMYMDAYPSPHNALPNRQNTVFQPTLPHRNNPNYHFSPSESTYSQILDTGSNYYGQQEDGALYSVGYCALNDPASQNRVPPVPSYPPPPLSHVYNSQKVYNDARRHLGASMDHHLDNNVGFHDSHEMVEQRGNGGPFYSARTGASTSGSHKSDSPHTEVSVLNSYNSAGRRARTLNRGSPPRNILDFVPPPPPLEERGYASSYPRGDYGQGKIYMQPADGAPKDTYIPISEDQSHYPQAKIVRNRSRQGYLESGRRSRGTDEDTSQRSSLIAAADEEEEAAQQAEKTRRAYESDDEVNMPQGDINGSFANRHVPYMGRLAKNNSTSHEIGGLPRRPTTQQRATADCV
uniref:Roundabout homolog 2 n=1 Tax=Panagrellus redivivus TaxID=6233 RepID=A0A7E4WC32_PANRE